MTTKHKESKSPHSATLTESDPNETGVTGYQSAVFDQILFGIPDKDLNSTFAQASVHANTKTMNLSVANRNFVVLGQSSTAHHSDTHLLRKSQEEADPRRADGQVERLQPMDAGESSIVQCFSKPVVSEEESQRKTRNSSDEILLDVESSLPVIKKQGVLNGIQCEEILKNLELLQDNGEFEHHKRLFNFCLEQCVAKSRKGMEVIVNEQQIPIGEHCNQICKRLKEDKQLFSLYSRLCTKQEYADMELALIIEQGVSFMYNKQLRKSKLYFTSVIELAGQCQLRNPNILMARAYFLLAANCSCRKPKNFSTFFECLRRSEALLQNHESPEDWAEMYYTLGFIWLNYMSMVPDDERNAKARKETQEKAKTYYEWAIAVCMKDPRPTLKGST